MCLRIALTIAFGIPVVVHSSRATLLLQTIAEIASKIKHVSPGVDMQSLLAMMPGIPERGRERERARVKESERK